MDNVDKPALLSDEQTKRLPKAEWLCLLATTRLGPEELESCDEEGFLSVDELPETDALALIESYQSGRSFKEGSQRDAALQIVRLLGGMPLAVEVAAIFMGEHRIPCTAFYERLKNDGRDYFSKVENDKRGKVRHGAKCLQVTLQPTLTALSDEERLALEYATLHPPDHILLPWLKDLAAIEHPEFEETVEVGMPDPWLNVVRKLLSLRLLQETGAVDQDGNPLITRMHRLVGEVVRQAMPVETVAARQSVILGVAFESAKTLYELSESNPGAIWHARPLQELCRLWWDIGSTREFANICLCAGMIESKMGKMQIAKPFLERALGMFNALQRKVPIDDNELSDMALDNDFLGGVLQAQGDLTGGLKAYQASLGIRARLVDTDSSHAGWQRDVRVSYARIASALEAVEDNCAPDMCRMAYAALSQ